MRDKNTTKLETADGKPQKNADMQQTIDVDCIVYHLDRGSNVKYVVRWYGNVCTDITAEPPKHTLEHSI